MRTVRPVTVALAVLALVGCLATGPRRDDDPVAALGRLRTELAGGEGAVGAVVAAADRLAAAPPGDLEAARQDYTRAAATVALQADRVQALLASLRAARDDIDASWEERLAAVEDERLHERFSQHRDEVLARFGTAQSACRRAAGELEAWLRFVDDVGSHLRLHPAPDDVASLAEHFDAITSRGQDVDTTLDELLRHLGALITLIGS